MISQKEIRYKIRHFATQKFDEGSRIIVPVIGSGFSKQMEVHKDESWSGLLTALEQEIGHDCHPESSQRPSSFTSRWESLVISNARKEQKRHGAKTAERQLKRRIVKILREWETHHIKNHEYEDSGYHKILNANFKDIISLNIDRRLAIRGNNGSKRTIRNHSKHKSSARASIYRHDLVKRDNLNSRIWYPHGDTSNMETIKLGVAEYGKYIEDLMMAFNTMKVHENGIISEKFDLMKDYSQWRQTLRTTNRHINSLSWVEVAMNSPLLFIGVGLTSDEWPLWWLLHQHARNKVRVCHEDKNPVFVLTFDGIPDHLRHNPAGIHVANFPDADDLWDFVWKIFS